MNGKPNTQLPGSAPSVAEAPENIQSEALATFESLKASVGQSQALLIQSGENAAGLLSIIAKQQQVILDLLNNVVAPLVALVGSPTSAEQ